MKLQRLYDTVQVYAVVILVCMSGCDSGGGGDEDGNTDVETDTLAETAEDTTVEVVEDEVEVPCTLDAECDDEDPCTADTCDTDLGECEHDIVDEDGDGVPAAEVDGESCGGSDCDDADDAIHPGADTGCAEGDDRDCDGLDDRDEDDDGYVSAECSGGDDCDDQDAGIFPGSAAIDCTILDHDCNGQPDRDNDGDGDTRDDCGGHDCDDEDATVYLGAEEIPCDGKNTDCVGMMDPEEDVDQDGHPNDTCAPDGVAVDCNDSDRDIFPGATERCDEVDDDCDGTWGDGGADDDSDTVLDEICGGDDCDDTDADAYPGSTFNDCSDLDHDCNGNPDRDNDDDGHDAEICSGDDCDDADADRSPSAPPGCTVGDDFDCDGLDDPDEDGDGHLHLLCAGGDDCDDGRDDAFPGAWEICGDGVDQNCDTVADNTGPVVAEMPLYSGIRRAGAPKIVWSGSEFGVSWKGSEPGWAGIHLTRVDQAGNIVGSETPITAAGVTNLSNNDIAWSGSEYGIAWDGIQDVHWDIFLSRVSPDGVLVGSTTRVTDVTDFSQYPSVAWDGSAWGIVWNDQRLWNYDVFFASVSPDGVKLTSDVHLSDKSGGSYYPTIAAVPGTFGVTWNGSADGGNTSYWARVGSDGAVLGSSTAVAEVITNYFSPSIATTASDFILGWEHLDVSTLAIHATLYGADGTRLISDHQVSLGGVSTEDPQMAWSGSEIGFVWQDRRDGNIEVYFGHVSDTGAKYGSDLRISQATNNSWYADIAWTGSAYGIVWSDNRDGTTEIYFSLVTTCR